jgi:hypothetical protein
LAYTTVTNAEFKHFFVPGVGSIAYLQCRRYGRRVIMACNDPLAPKALWEPLSARFFAFEPSAYVSHASREYATVLQGMGKIVNHFGIEPIVSLFWWLLFGVLVSERRLFFFLSLSLGPPRSQKQKQKQKHTKQNQNTPKKPSRSRPTSTTSAGPRCASPARRSGARATRA